MNFSKTFVDRPIATSLVMAAIFLAGLLAFARLPIAPLPRVDYPTFTVQAMFPGADPEIMASAVATPLERQFAQKAQLGRLLVGAEDGQVVAHGVLHGLVGGQRRAGAAAQLSRGLALGRGVVQAFLHHAPRGGFGNASRVDHGGSRRAPLRTPAAARGRG